MKTRLFVIVIFLASFFGILSDFIIPGLNDMNYKYNSYHLETELQACQKEIDDFYNMLESEGIRASNYGESVFERLDSLYYEREEIQIKQDELHSNYNEPEYDLKYFLALCLNLILSASILTRRKKNVVKKKPGRPTRKDDTIIDGLFDRYHYPNPRIQPKRKAL